MKKYFKIFVYISLIFLLYALYKGNYIYYPDIKSYESLISSLFLLWFGFIISSIGWWGILYKSGIKINLSSAFASVGLSIFGKYIPGKLWTILGRASYTETKTSTSLKYLSVISFNAQILTIWAGLFAGTIGLYFLNDKHIWFLLTSLAFIITTIYVYSNVFHAIIENIGKLIFNKKIKLPHLDPKQTLVLVPLFLGNTLIISLAFYFFCQSLLMENLPLYVGLGFPLAGTLGIMAIIFPGGIGVREGILVGYLTLAGLSTADAATISVASRLWFLIGEGFMFLVGVVSDRINRKKIMNHNCNKIYKNAFWGLFCIGILWKGFLLSQNQVIQTDSAGYLWAAENFINGKGFSSNIIDYFVKKGR